jgi:iron complex outermembrane receptor protein
LYHIQGEYKFDLKPYQLIAGGNYRIYKPNSNGTIFSDTNGVVITNKEYGIYTGFERNIFREKLKLTATVRLDKNQNFDYNISPAISGVYTINNKHFARLSYSAAIRNPTLIDQYIYYDVGRAVLVGNIHGFDSLVTIESLGKGFAYGKDSLKYFNVDPIRTEKVHTIELGYRGIISNKLYVDAVYYYSFYKDFIGYDIGAKVRTSSYQPIVDSIYRVSANSNDDVSTQGFSLGFNYYLTKICELTGNYSWNVLDRHGSTDPLIPAFNTPEHKFNIGINGRDIHTSFSVFDLTVPVNNYGFSINYKWIDGFLFEGSPQFTGYVKTYDLVDVQVNKYVPSISCTFKLGASNVLDNRAYQVYGGPRVGRLAYFSILFELKKNK